ncbi:SDR family NAD(P)-dependent oxidoreductase [Colwelliaceae bacterium 6441]
MKALKEIYHDLSIGRLTRAEALIKIKAIQSKQTDNKATALHAAPHWKMADVTTSSNNNEARDCQHELILCQPDSTQFDLNQLNKILPYHNCLLLSLKKNQSIHQQYSDIALACFEYIKTLLAGKPQQAVHIQMVLPNDEHGAFYIGLSGLLKTATQENPKLTAQIILVEPNVITSQLNTQLAKQLSDERTRVQDTVVKYQNGNRYIQLWDSIVPQSINDEKDSQCVFKDSGVYLITGGLGALGRLFAQEILKTSSMAKVILTGRAALTETEILAAKRSITNDAAEQLHRITYCSVDLDNVKQTQHLVDLIVADHHQLNGIIHCAGMHADNFILKKSSLEFREVLTPKVTGTVHLDEASKTINLDFFVLFSSVASWLGNIGQADYAAANGFMDQFSAYRNQLVNKQERQGQTRSINWPLWQDGGMNIDQANFERLQKETGAQSLQTSTGMAAFHRSLAIPHDQLLVMEGDIAKLQRTLHAKQNVSSQVTNTSVTAPKEIVEKVTDSSELHMVDAQMLLNKTQDYLCAEFSKLLKLPAHQIDSKAPLEKYGIDSILAINLTNQLEKTFGSLPKTLFFEYQTIKELAVYFIQSYTTQLTTLFYPSTMNSAVSHAEQTGENNTNTIATNNVSRINRISTKRKGRNSNKPEVVNETEQQMKTQLNAEPIAIVGLSGRYPEAVNINDYWHNLRDGKDCIVEVPKSRWDWQKFYSEDRTKADHHYSKWGGFIEGVDEFDPRFFNISPKEAKAIDPQERLFLQHAWMAVEDAGYTRDSLQVPAEHDQAGQVGVYAGVMYGEYNLSGSLATIANRVSYAFNLHGPSMTLDTMCSSSLTAIHLACQDLKLGRTSLAIAGGVNISVHPSKYQMLSGAQFISSDGHCQSFGEGGDGYIPGEGVGVVLLKRLSEAKRDNDHIYGVIKSSSLNHGGKTNGYSVPNPQSQASAITRALLESGTDPRHVSYIEAHGTGTKLGDPIEIAALTKAFSQHAQSRTDKTFGVCAIGSAKSNIGHCESAAGIAGLTKILLQMKYQQIVPSLHSAQLNPNIDFDKTPFVVNQTLTDWSQPIIDGQSQPRIAGLSSFGAGGSNAHFIIEEYQNVTPVVEEPQQVIIPLSARTRAQLKEKAQDLFSFIQTTASNKYSLNAMAYTLQIGREAMNQRVGFIVTSVEQLADKLQSYIQDEFGQADIYQGEVSNNKATLSLFSTDDDLQQTIDKWILEGKQEKLIDLWVKGLELDWHKFYDVKPMRMSLPTYPFAKERYWIEPIGVGESISNLNNANMSVEGVNVIHPLLHQNISDLFQQSYTSSFTGNEFFVLQHPKNGEKLLAPMAHLEMARAAIDNAMPTAKGSTVEIHNTVWAQTVAVNEPSKVAIALLAEDNEHINFEMYAPDAEIETIYCQGQVVLSTQTAPIKVDINKLKEVMQSEKVLSTSENIELYRGENQLLARFNFVNVQQNNNQFIVPPILLDSALQLAAIIDQKETNQIFSPTNMDIMRINAACSQNMYVWVRHSISLSSEVESRHTATGVDIDLIDEQGNVCLQIIGLNYQEAFIETNEVTLEALSETVTTSTVVIPELPPMLNETIEPKKVNFLAPELLPIDKVNIEKSIIDKPKGIVLTTPINKTLFSAFESKAQMPQITLSKAKLKTADSNSTLHDTVSLYAEGNGVFSITVASIDEKQELTAVVIEQLIQAFNKVQQEVGVKAIILSGTENGFLTGDRQASNIGVEKSLFKTIISFPYPVIASMVGNTKDTGFLIGTLCDFMVCSSEGQYAYTNIEKGFYPTIQEQHFFKARLGDELANDFLNQSGVISGEALKQAGWGCAILPKNQVDAYVKKLALNLSIKPQISLRLLKKHLARNLLGYVNDFAIAETDIVAQAQQENEATSKKRAEVYSPIKHIQLIDMTNYVAVINIAIAKGKYGIKGLFGHLKTLFTRIKNSGLYKAVVLTSEYENFLPESKFDRHIIANLQSLLLDFSLPVVGAISTNAKGDAWYISQFFDTCIYHDNGTYCADSIWLDTPLGKDALMIFTHRFGHYLGKEILLTGKKYLGNELQQQAPQLKVVAQDKVVSTALAFAQSLTQLPLAMLLAQKQSFASNIKDKIANLPSWLEQQTTEFMPHQKSSTDEPYVVPLSSKVISAFAYPDGVLMVKMADKQAKNMFSEEFVVGMNEVFTHIENTSSYKVVLLTGYDNYFATGGTKEGLLEIQQGKGKFTDIDVFQLPMNCKIPVISAMQGHAIGAGWSMGMFADFSLFSDESKYLSPYMNYGFTPGAGATFIFMEKVGYDLARETLLTAQEYFGSELRDKGLAHPVLPRREIGAAAMTLAKALAQNSRDSLMACKHQWTHNQAQAVADTCQLELAMHEKTFVGQSNTLELIQASFSSTQSLAKPVDEVTTVLTNKGHTSPVIEVVHHDSVHAHTVTKTLKQLLAHELHMDAEEIEEDTQFIDLGLDSITGVTWIRKINEKYQTAIQATKVYTHPTINQMSAYVTEQIKEQGAITSPNVIFDIPRDNATQAIPQVTHVEAQALTGADNHSSSNTETLSEITHNLRRLLAHELHMAVEEIEDDIQFIDLGLDSITGVTWIRKINDSYKTLIEATKVYTYPTLNQMSAYVLKQLEELGPISVTSKESKTVTSLSEHEVKTPMSSQQTKTFASAPMAFKTLSSLRKSTTLRVPATLEPQINTTRQADNSAKSNQTDAIAVLGMAGQFPQANNIDEYWDNIAEGKNCISEITQKRWDVNRYYQEGAIVPGKTNSRWMGMLDEYDLFDPLFFTISPTEAESMEPQQRVFLQACWHSIENAGYNADDLSGSKCGVFVGCAAGDYGLLSREQQTSAQGFTGGATSILAARVSYFLNLRGPCLSIDTACSSSLVAIASACDSLNLGNSDIALAGGVYVMTGPDLHIKSSQAGMLSTDGRCYTFDHRANGFVPGEGVGVIMLKRLADAQRDKDNIQGVIQGWGVNQDGKTNGITAPNAESQMRLQQDIYDKFGIDPSNIQLIEAHGTGTKLGDPIEVEGLKESFKKYTDNQEYCALGSVKSNIGHCLTAAAVAGVIKLIMALKHKKLPPTGNFEKLNEHIGLKGSPFYVNNKLRDWTVAENERRHAAISSFGFSGTNAHMVIAEHQNLIKEAEQTTAITQNGNVIVPLSARTSEQLEQKVQDLLTYVEQQQSMSLFDVAYTLQTGRSGMEERIGFMVSSVEQLKEKLSAFVNGDKNIEGMYQGQVKSNKEGIRILSQNEDIKTTMLAKWIEQRNLSKILDLWVKGLPLDWHTLYGDVKPKRISLPNYPFEKERYWIEASDSVYQPEFNNNKTRVLHPLLHSNTSVLTLQNKGSINIEKGLGDKPKLIALPTYPFAKEKCWVDPGLLKADMSKTLTENERFIAGKDFSSIEDIMNKIDADSIETAEAVKLLNMLV